MIADEISFLVAPHDARDHIDRFLADFGRPADEVRRERWGLEPADIAEQENLLAAYGGALV